MTARRRWAVVVHWDNKAEEMGRFWTRGSAERERWWYVGYLAQIYWPFPPRVSISRTQVTR